jgi:indolepyruvate decarboxylase
MTDKESGADGQLSPSANGRPGEESERGLGRRTFLRAGVLAGGASLPIAAAARSAAASPRPALAEAASAVSGASGLTRQLTVAEYVVERLAALGIEHVFGVPGDYAFPFDNAIEASDRVSWVGNAHELNAAYAADGYARIRGAAILCTTYAVGELSALNGVMGSYAERLPVFTWSGSRAAGCSARGR